MNLDSFAAGVPAVNLQKKSLSRLRAASMRKSARFGARPRTEPTRPRRIRFRRCAILREAKKPTAKSSSDDDDELDEEDVNDILSLAPVLQSLKMHVLHRVEHVLCDGTWKGTWNVES